MSRTDFPDLVQTGWLADRLGQPDLRLIDASWYLPQAGRDARAEYHARRIGDAIFLDIDQISDPDSALPHMMPARQDFAARLGSFGIGAENMVVIYDGAGIFSAPRLWWMLKLMGHAKVAVLDGGMVKWLAEGRETHAGEGTYTATTYEFRDPKAFVSTQAEVLGGLAQNALVLDARSGARFRGEVAEPRAGLRSGHMNGAVSLPFGELLTEEGCLKSQEALQAIFENLGLKPDREVFTTCGSGVTAAILTLALSVIGFRARLYDGSWAEWGLPDGPQVVTGS